MLLSHLDAHFLGGLHDLGTDAVAREGSDLVGVLGRKSKNKCPSRFTLKGPLSMRLVRIFAFLATTMLSRDAADVWARRETEAGTTGAKLNADAPATRARTKMDLRVGTASRRVVSRGARLAEPRTWWPRNYQTHRARGGNHERGSGRRASGARRAAPRPPRKTIISCRADPACLVASVSSRQAAAARAGELRPLAWPRACASARQAPRAGIALKHLSGPSDHASTCQTIPHPRPPAAHCPRACTVALKRFLHVFCTTSVNYF
jgi:hypothetical protein